MVYQNKCHCEKICQLGRVAKKSMTKLQLYNLVHAQYGSYTQA